MSLFSTCITEKKNWHLTNDKCRDKTNKTNKLKTRNMSSKKDAYRHKMFYCYNSKSQQQQQQKL